MRGFDVVEPGVFRDPRSGKIYTSVSYRTRQFRVAHPTWGVNFFEVDYPEGNGATQADPRGRFIKMRCEIRDDTDRLVAVGHAEEDRKFGPVNKTSAIENAETSAYGRALACLGFLSDQYASAEEVDQAMATERKMEAYASGRMPPDPADEPVPKVVPKTEGDAPQRRVVQPQPSKNDTDANPFSQEFRDLLVRIGTIRTRDELNDIKTEIKEVRNDLSDAELSELKTQFLAQSARVK